MAGVPPGGTAVARPDPAQSRAPSCFRRPPQHYRHLLALAEDSAEVRCSLRRGPLLCCRAAKQRGGRLPVLGEPPRGAATCQGSPKYTADVHARASFATSGHTVPPLAPAQLVCARRRDRLSVGAARPPLASCSAGSSSLVMAEGNVHTRCAEPSTGESIAIEEATACARRRPSLAPTGGRHRLGLQLSALLRYPAPENPALNHRITPACACWAEPAITWLGSAR